MKRVLTSVMLLMLVVVLAVSAASCGGDGSNTSSGQADMSVPGGFTNVEPAVLEALSQSGTVSVYMLNRSEYSDWDKSFNEYFSSVYGGTVNPSFMPWSGWEKTFLNDFMTGNSPDLFYIFEKLWPKAATRDLAFTMDELTAKGVVGLDHYWLQDGLEGIQNFYTNQGKVYSFAKNMNEPVVMMINEDIFAKYEVTSPTELFKQGKWNYETFLDCAIKTTKDLNDDGTTDQWGYQGWDWSYVVQAAGGDLVIFDNDGVIKTNFDDAKTIKGLQNLREIYGTYKVSKWNTIGAENFVAGQIAMCAMLPNNFATQPNSDKNIADATFKWNVIPYPLDAGNTSGQRPGYCYGWAVSTAAKNPQGAVNYIIAKNCYTSTNPDPNAADFSVYTDEQMAMFEEYSQHCRLPIFQGVANLINLQWSMRDSISGGSQEINEIIDKYEGQWQGQVDEENAGGAV